MIRCTNISKIYSRDVDDSRLYALFDLMRNRSKRLLRLRRNEFYALNNVSFSLSQGQNLLVLGALGSGRSTLANILCGLSYPTKGEVVLNGMPRLIRSNHYGGTPLMTLREYVRFVVAVCGGGDSLQLCDEVLAMSELQERQFSKLRNLPGMVLKKINFLVALYLDADVYVFDDLITMGDGFFQERCDGFVNKILKSKTAIVCTNKPDSIIADMDYAILLHEGSIFYEGNPEQVWAVHNELVNSVPMSNELAGSLYQEETEYVFNESANEYEDTVEESKPKSKAAKKKAIIQSDVRERIQNVQKALARNDSAVELRRNLEKIISRDKPLLIGPFISGVGFELLYWIPFLEWIKNEYSLSEDQFATISRGGADYWYKSLGSRHIDIIDVMDEQEFNAKQSDRISRLNLKQFHMSDLETDILNRAARSLNIDSFSTIHPSLMYKLFKPVWKKTLPLNFIFHHTRFKPFSKETKPLITQELPKEYVAARFHYSPYFPESKPVDFFVAELIKIISREVPVVIVNTGILVDTHTDIPIEKNDNIFHLNTQATPRNNFMIQTEIVKNARFYMGAFGGFSFLPPFYSVPSMVFYANDRGALQLHRDIAHYFFQRENQTEYQTLNISRADTMEIVSQILTNFREKKNRISC